MNRPELSIHRSKLQRAKDLKALDKAKKIESKRLKENWQYVQREDGAMVLRKINDKL